MSGLGRPIFRDGRSPSTKCAVLWPLIGGILVALIWLAVFVWIPSEPRERTGWYALIFPVLGLVFALVALGRRRRSQR